MAMYVDMSVHVLFIGNYEVNYRTAYFVDQFVNSSTSTGYSGNQMWGDCTFKSGLHLWLYAPGCKSLKMPFIELQNA